eukprot:5903570-Prymnesium_polylepis.1
MGGAPRAGSRSLAAPVRASALTCRPSRRPSSRGARRPRPCGARAAPPPSRRSRASRAGGSRRTAAAAARPAQRVWNARGPAAAA